MEDVGWRMEELSPWPGLLNPKVTLLGWLFLEDGG